VSLKRGYVPAKGKTRASRTQPCRRGAQSCDNPVQQPDSTRGQPYMLPAILLSSFLCRLELSQPMKSTGIRAMSHARKPRAMGASSQAEIFSGSQADQKGWRVFSPSGSYLCSRQAFPQTVARNLSNKLYERMPCSSLNDPQQSGTADETSHPCSPISPR
jgi:hypothetical protein